MFENPEFVRFVAGFIVGGLLGLAVTRIPRLQEKLLVIGVVIILYLAFEGGAQHLESTIVNWLRDFFASSQFAFGSIVGVLISTSVARARVEAR